MSVKRFKFVSPGVFINEIDNSQLPKTPDRMGPVVIGRTERGPAMRPVTVSSQSEFVEMFGEPIPGGFSGDVWRDGNYQSPTYASYAAMAYLRNNGPVTMVRLLGHQHENATTGLAGWDCTRAMGLWLYDSASAGSGIQNGDRQEITGTLAAIWYFDKGIIALSGTQNLSDGDGAPTLKESVCMGILNSGANTEFKATIWEDENTFDSTTQILQTTFNFDKNSDKFIRKVFNTNPSLASDKGEISSVGGITAKNQKEYWLGQTFEDNIGDYLSNTGGTNDRVVGLIAPLSDAETASKSYKTFTGAATSATSGWVISQQLGTDSASFNPKATVPVGCNRLFKFNALDCGEWESKNLKISISDILYSRNEEENPFGTFTVQIRRAQDNDMAPQVVETYANCNLNPQSPNYIKRKIGDQTLSWDEAERRYKVIGDYPNNSRFVRVEVNGELDNAALDPTLLPFGFQGPPGLNTIEVAAQPARNYAELKANSGAVPIMMSLTGKAHNGADSDYIYFGHPNLKLEFPKLRMRVNSEEGALANRRKAYWGISCLETGSAKRFNRGYKDLVYSLPDGITLGHANAPNASFAFSLDDVVLADGLATWDDTGVATTMARAMGTSYSATSGSTGSIDQGIDRFTLPLWGGFDGLDVKALDPFAPTLHIGDSATDKSSYEYYTVRKGIDMVADPEVVECNIMTVPGITNNGINQHLVNVAESRADCLAILDLKNGYLPRADRTAGAEYSAYGGTVDATLNNLRDLGINSSYACCYYPWVQIRDTSQDAVIWVPPSVVALGTMGSSETKSAVWFAPAGFTRGGLTEGAAGMPVVGVRDRLTSRQRDKLYAANVNPIATFPAEGIVIFGQKTMQVTPSALDRINVRRLMIFVKKEISRMAATTLFEQNVSRTWNRFLGRVNPFLGSVRARLGLTDFRVILDETTTTPELIDRNIMYAKILLKPARAIEFIAIDFVITNSGASFED
jgi:hypothetical protein